MGNKNTPINKYIDDELKKSTKNEKSNLEDKEEKQLLQLCQPYFYNQQDFMIENNFKYMLQLSDDKIFEIIFKIFGSIIENEHRIIYFEEIKYFYYCLKMPNPKIKLIFVAFLLFQNEDNIKDIDLNNNIFKIFKNDIGIQGYLSIICNELSEIKINKKENE